MYNAAQIQKRYGRSNIKKKLKQTAIVAFELFSRLVFRSLSFTIGQKLLLLCPEPAFLSFRKNKTPCIMGVLWPARARCRGF